jgi:tetratricopeptide (TPR) repeat protein
MLRFSFFFIYLTFMIISFSCSSDKKEKQKLYNIPEIDKLSAEILKNPKNAALYAARSVLFSRNELAQEAELDAEKALSLDSAKMDYYVLLTDAYFNNNHSHAAVKNMQKAIGRFPQETKLYLNLAEMQMLVEQYNDCVLTLDMLFKIQPENPDGLFIKGQVFKLTGDTSRAIQSFEKVVELDAENIDAYMELALHYNRKSDPKTLSYLENVLRLDSMNEAALLTKAQYYHFRSEYEQAKKEYENAILKHSQSAEFNYNLALMYLEMGDNSKSKGKKEESVKNYESAWKHFDNSTKFDVQFADAYYYKAISAERLNNKEAAIKDYNNALRLQGNLQFVLPQDIEAALNKLEQ